MISNFKIRALFKRGFFVYKSVYIKSTRIEISTGHKRNSVCITFHCGWNEIKFRSRGGPRNTAHLVRPNHSCFDEINACPDVSFRMISFRVLFTWHFITQNEVSSLSIWRNQIWRNTIWRNKITHAMSFIPGSVL